MCGLFTRIPVRPTAGVEECSVLYTILFSTGSDVLNKGKSGSRALAIDGFPFILVARLSCFNKTLCDFQNLVRPCSGPLPSARATLVIAVASGKLRATMDWQPLRHHPIRCNWSAG